VTAPTHAERIAAIAALVDALTTKGHRVGLELLHGARFVPGWSIRRERHGLLGVDGGGVSGAVFTREQTIAHLRATWLDDARAELPDTTESEKPVTDGITEAAKMEAEPEPAFPLDVAIKESDSGVDIFVNASHVLLCSRHDAAVLRDALDAFLQGQP
jgi:N-acetylglucosamine kinase-like BadF-type ATPase